jgi:hypothetical protein
MPLIGVSQILEKGGLLAGLTFAAGFLGIWAVCLGLLHAWRGVTVRGSHDVESSRPGLWKRDRRVRAAGRKYSSWRLLQRRVSERHEFVGRIRDMAHVTQPGK